MTKYKSNNVYILREKTGLSRKDLAKALGISLKSIEAYEYGWRNPSSEVLTKMHELFGWQPNQVIFYDSI